MNRWQPMKWKKQSKRCGWIWSSKQNNLFWNQQLIKCLTILSGLLLFIFVNFFFFRFIHSVVISSVQGQFGDDFVSLCTVNERETTWALLTILFNLLFSATFVLQIISLFVAIMWPSRNRIRQGLARTGTRKNRKWKIEIW